MAVEDVDDDAGAVEHLGAGGALQVAHLAGRDVVVDHHHRGELRVEVRSGAHRGFDLVAVVVLVELGRGVALRLGLPSLARLRLPLAGAGGDHAAAAGQLGELLELPLAEDGGGGERPRR